MLDVGDGHTIRWEACGALGGRPAVVLHGGPGSGCAPWWRRLFDPRAYRVVLFDQRGCGGSLPHAGDPDPDLSANTTGHLIADIELLRERLGIERWLVLGGSWGSTLGLAYAERHPERVSAMVLFSVCTTTRADIAWTTRGIARFFPEAFARLRAGVPESERDGDLTAAYNRLLLDPEPAVHERAARAWCAWEEALGGGPDPRFADPRFRLGLARLVTHHWSNAAFLDDGALLRDAVRLSGIRGALIHGRLDVGAPVDVPYALAQAWDGCELVIVEDAGHGARSGAIGPAIVAATDRLASAVRTVGGGAAAPGNHDRPTQSSLSDA
jgi:proline iminopeptidase